MKPLEVWSNVGRRLFEYEKQCGFTNEDLECDVIVFNILKELEKKGEDL